MATKSGPKSNPWQLTAFLLIGIIVGYGFGQVLPVSSEVSLFGAGKDVQERGNDPIVVQVGGDEQQGDVIEPEVLDVSIDDDEVLGDPKAPITIVEFSDFQCSFCQRFHVNTFGQLKEAYIDTGKVNFVYRDYPLGFHANAMPAAEAAECAGEQDMYWEMHDMIFTNLSEWEGSPEADQLFATYATDIGLEIGAFESCVASDDMEAEIKGDMADALKYGVSATPTFFVNGKRVVGAQPFSVFSGIIDGLLEE